MAERDEVGRGVVGPEVPRVRFIALVVAVTTFGCSLIYAFSNIIQPMGTPSFWRELARGFSLLLN